MNFAILNHSELAKSSVALEYYSRATELGIIISLDQPIPGYLDRVQISTSIKETSISTKNQGEYLEIGWEEDQHALQLHHSRIQVGVYMAT